MTDVDPPTVRPGQIWADNDPRSAGRTLLVVRVDGDPFDGSHIAVCTVLTVSGGRRPTWGRNRLVRIQAARMRPTANGYRFVQDMPTE